MDGVARDFLGTLQASMSSVRICAPRAHVHLCSMEQRLYSDCTVNGADDGALREQGSVRVGGWEISVHGLAVSDAALEHLIDL